MSYRLGAFVATAFVGLLLSTAPGFAQTAAQSTCTNPGRVAAFTNIPAGGENVLPSVGKQLAGVGLAARNAGCVAHAVCISADGSDAARTTASERCNSARAAMIRGGSTPSWGRDKFTVSRRTPGDGMQANGVYIVFE